MSKFIILAISLFSISITSSQTINKINAPTKINKITLFLTGGEITRTAKLKLKKGRNKIIFPRISTVIDQKSIQFTSDKQSHLVSISTEIDYTSKHETNTRIKAINDSLLLTNDLITDIDNEKTAYASEKRLLEKNNSIKGTQKNLTVEELRNMATFYRKRMLAINTKISSLTKTGQALRIKSQLFSSQLNELNFKENAHSNQVIVIIDSDVPQSINGELKYIVSNCGWQANYDLSASDINEKINLAYKAKVYNNTGNDWTNINLTLSTTNPNISASAPDLKPWYLNNQCVVNDDYKERGYMVPQRNQYKKLYNNSSSPQQNQQLDGMYLSGEGRFNFKANGTNQYVNPTVQIKTIEIPQLSSEFEIEKKYSIPTDSKPYIVEISKHNLEATFSHKAVPKLDKDAFLLANIVGWEKLNLISGPTNVYYADTYVGQSYINTRNVEDTLRLSFGRDKKVLVTRKKLDQFSTKKVLGSNKKDTYTYEITIKNNQNINLKMDLFDQIPVSQQSEISVTTNETSEANYNEENGVLKWKVNLAPGEVKKYKISFTIKYPKNKNIQVKKFRTISAPSF